MPPLKKILPPIVGTITGLAIGFFIMTTTIVTEPGYESVLKIEPPFLSGHLTMDSDGPGTHRHLRFIYGVPVKMIQEFNETGAVLITKDLGSMKADISVTLKVADAAELLWAAGSDWYAQEIQMAVAASAGLAGLSFSQKDLEELNPKQRVLLDMMATAHLQKIIAEKNLPLDVIDYKVMKVYPGKTDI